MASPPPNDNFANATPISLGQALFGSNYAATSEVGEPQNAGKTVWWQWTSPYNGLVVASTRPSDTLQIIGGIFSPTGNPFSGQTPTNFYSNIQVFTGASGATVSEITEVSYVEQFTNGFLPTANYMPRAFLAMAYEYGSLVSFNATAGTTYWIRVDARFDPNGGNQLPDNGAICVSLNTCCTRECPSGFNIKSFLATSPTVLGTVSVSGTATTSFGTFAKGKYIVAWQSGFLTAGYACSVGLGDGYEEQDYYFTSGMSNSGVVAFLTVNGCQLCGGAGGACNCYDGTCNGWSQAEANAEANPPWVLVDHPGGDLTLSLVALPNQSYEVAPGSYITGINITGGPITYAVYAFSQNCNQFFSAPSITNAFFNCNGTGVLDVLINNPQLDAAQYTLSLSDVVGFTPLINTVTLSPIAGNTGVPFSIKGAPAFGQSASATITLTDQNGNSCSTFDFTANLQNGFVANGATVTSTQNGVFNGTFSIELQSALGCEIFSGCTVELLASGGVIDPSGPLTDVTFNAGQSTPLAFNFDGNGSGTLTATLNIYSSDGAQLAAIEFELSANVAISSISTGAATYNSMTFCGGCEGAVITVKNNGLLPSYDVQVSILNTCTGVEQMVDIGVLNPGQTVNMTIPFNIPGVSCAGAGTEVTASMQMVPPTGSATSFPNYQWNNYCGCPS